jgi:hypothetical protein
LFLFAIELILCCVFLRLFFAVADPAATQFQKELPYAHDKNCEWLKYISPSSKRVSSSASGSDVSTLTTEDLPVVCDRSFLDIPEVQNPSTAVQSCLLRVKGILQLLDCLSGRKLEGIKLVNDSNNAGIFNIISAAEKVLQSLIQRNAANTSHGNVLENNKEATSLWSFLEKLEHNSVSGETDGLGDDADASIKLLRKSVLLTVCGWSAVNLSPVKTGGTGTNTDSTTLSVDGKKPDNNGHCSISCTICGRSLQTKSLFSLSTPLRAKAVLEQHRSYCPWINTQSHVPASSVHCFAPEAGVFGQRVGGVSAAAGYPQGGQLCAALGWQLACAVLVQPMWHAVWGPTDTSIDVGKGSSSASHLSQALVPVESAREVDSTTESSASLGSRLASDQLVSLPNTFKRIKTLLN